MDRPVLEIDIAKSSFDVALIHMEKQRHRTFNNRVEGFEQLENWLFASGIQHVHACMEATGRYGQELAQYLYEQGHKVSVVNPVPFKNLIPSSLG